jgi:hypothetical protein
MPLVWFFFSYLLLPLDICRIIITAGNLITPKERGASMILSNPLLFIHTAQRTRWLHLESTRRSCGTHACQGMMPYSLGWKGRTKSTIRWFVMRKILFIGWKSTAGKTSEQVVSITLYADAVPGRGLRPGSVPSRVPRLLRAFALEILKSRK